MIIHEPETETRDDRVIVSARVEFKTSIRRWNDGRWFESGDRLWFSFNSQFADFIAESSESFVSALVLLAMALGEDIEVRGTLSPRLAYGLDHYQAAFAMWFPQLYKRVTITPTRYESRPTRPATNGVLASFTGGVDSFYTLWANHPERETRPGMALSHLLFLDNISFTHDEPHRESYLALIQRAANAVKLPLIVVDTNVRPFSASVAGAGQWDFAFGTALAACAQLMGRQFHRFYIPAGRTFITMDPVGSLPYIDPFLSTDTLEVFHHGSGVSRTRKTLTIADWPLTYDHLLVCFNSRTSPMRNCCRCSKCLRTMLALEIAGKLDAYATFPKPLDYGLLREVSNLKGEREQFYIDDLISEATAAGRDDLVNHLGAYKRTIAKAQRLRERRESMGPVARRWEAIRSVGRDAVDKLPRGAQRPIKSVVRFVKRLS